MAIKQEANSPLIITVGIVAAMMVLIIMIGLQAWFVNEERSEIEAKWQMNRNTALIDLNNAQQKRLADYAWTDREKQTVSIPIDDAMRIIVSKGGKLPATQPKNN